MQLIRAMASWPTEVEVKGAPQIKCHTRRSVGPSCGTQIRPEEKSESDTFLRHETQLKKLLHLQGLNFVLFCSSAPFDVLSFDVKFFFFFFTSTMPLLSSWFQRLKLLSPFFVAWAVSDCPCHGCFVLHRPSLTHVKEKGEELHQSLAEMDSPPLD